MAKVTGSCVVHNRKSIEALIWSPCLVRGHQILVERGSLHLDTNGALLPCKKKAKTPAPKPWSQLSSSQLLVNISCLTDLVVATQLPSQSLLPFLPKVEIYIHSILLRSVSQVPTEPTLPLSRGFKGTKHPSGTHCLHSPEEARRCRPWRLSHQEIQSSADLEAKPHDKNCSQATDKVHWRTSHLPRVP